MVRRKGSAGDLGEPEVDVKRPRVAMSPQPNLSKTSWIGEPVDGVMSPKVSPVRQAGPPPIVGEGPIRCAHWNCKTRKDGGYAAMEGLKYCIKHKCEVPECPYQVQGSSKRCKGHGGGKRCVTEGCTKSAQGYTPHCNNHGGGKRCTAPDCSKPARVKGGFCNAHSEAARCKMPGCQKYKQKSGFCISHFKSEETTKGNDMLAPQNPHSPVRQPNSNTIVTL